MPNVIMPSFIALLSKGNHGITTIKRSKTINKSKNLSIITVPKACAVSILLFLDTL